MKIHRAAAALVAINLVLLVVILLPLRPAHGQPGPQTIAAVLRARSLEIVDEKGRTRAQIVTVPAGVRQGVSYPDTVLFRLIDPLGQPSVKLAVSSEGSGLDMLGGPDDKGWYGVQVIADAQGGSIRLVDRQGRQVQLQP